MQDEDAYKKNIGGFRELFCLALSTFEKSVEGYVELHNLAEERRKEIIELHGQLEFARKCNDELTTAIRQKQKLDEAYQLLEKIYNDKTLLYQGDDNKFIGIRTDKKLYLMLKNFIEAQK